MKIIVRTTIWIAGLALAVPACSDDGGSDGGGGSSGSGGSGTSGSASGTGAKGGAQSTAGTTSGGSTAGGNSSGSGGTGGSSGGSGGSGGSASNICSPGETTPAVFAYPDVLQNCGFEGKGELEGQGGFYTSIKLPAPIGPGDEFAFSVGLGELGEGTMELWGGSAECGEAHEHFATVQIPKGGEKGGARCMTARPQTGTYPYLIWVMHTAGAHGDVTLCPDVVCPGE